MSNADGYLNILLEPIYAQKLCCSRNEETLLDFSGLLEVRKFKYFHVSSETTEISK